MRRIVPFLALLASTFGWAQSEPAAEKIAQRVDRKYNQLQTIRMEFVETYSGGGRERTESGTLWLKQPGRMRWEYKQPREKLFVADGKNAFFYVPGERQARRAAIKKLDDVRSPLRFLLGKAKLSKEMNGLHIADTVTTLRPGNVVLAGVPKHMADRVQQVLIEVAPSNQIVRLVIEDVDGTVTEFRFSDIAENVMLKDGLFKFVPPKNVELVEAQELAD
ncbi:MAG: outer membrane lipoprotein chaperone LolA [Acidobacteriales bacterium]|nr:outer membrane lipoprotein chaperone LolA [Terriglobales bacterium]